MCFKLHVILLSALLSFSALANSLSDDCEELLSHFKALNLLSKEDLKSKRSRAQLEEIMKTAARALQKRGAFTLRVSRNKLQIIGDPGQANPSQVEQLAIDLQTENVDLIFAPRLLILENAGAMFSNLTRRNPQIWLSPEEIATGETQDAAAHELCHKKNTMIWRNGGKSIYSIEFKARKGSQLVSHRSYYKNFGIEELDCYSEQIQWLINTLIKDEAGARDVDYYSRRQMYLSRIISLIRTVETLNEAAQTWSTAASERLEQVLAQWTPKKPAPKKCFKIFKHKYEPAVQVILDEAIVSVTLPEEIQFYNDCERSSIAVYQLLRSAKDELDLRLELMQMYKEYFAQLSAAYYADRLTSLQLLRPTQESKRHQW